MSEEGLSPDSSLEADSLDLTPVREGNQTEEQGDSPECPRCGGYLGKFSLESDVEEASEHVCHDCGYVGIPVEHHSESQEKESWEEALKRFSEREDG